MTSAPLMLTVSGARGIVGESMTPDVARRYAGAFGTFIRNSSGADQPLLCVGRDSRPSGQALAAAAIQGLADAGCRVIDLGVVATPTVGVMIGKHRAAGGMVVTASHNPSQWNGLKCLNSDGVAPPPADIEQVIASFKSAISNEQLSIEDTVEQDATANAVHVEKVLACVNVDVIRAAKMKVVLDSVNGGGCMSGRLLLDALGCDVVHMNGEPTGNFAHTPEPLAENLTELAKRTRTESAICGFAQDPDADRLAIIDENGRYIGEEYTLVLAAKRVLNTHGPGVMAANLSTSRMIDDLAAGYPGSSVMRTAVGEAHVANVMKQHRAIIGGEGNGGVILPQVTWVRDSLSAMALVLDLLAAEKRPLSAIVDDLPRYAMIKEKVDLAQVGGRDVIDRGIEAVKRAFANESINAVDGVRIDFVAEATRHWRADSEMGGSGGTGGWVHLRPSNTEPIVRIIAEASSEKQARELIQRVRQVAGV